MGELEDVLAEIGIKQWVKNRFVGKLREFYGTGSKDVDKLIAEFNAEIFVDFKKEVNETIDEVIEHAFELMKDGAKL